MASATRFNGLLSPILSALFGAVVTLVWYSNENTEPRHSGYAYAVAIAVPSVVSIYSSRNDRLPFCQKERFRSWCESRANTEASRRESALGSGVVLRADGHIVTNDHVIAGADDIQVDTSSGALLQARLVGRDPETDVAVLQVDDDSLRPLTVAAPDSVSVGDIALAIGNPFGIGQTVSQGIVSALGQGSTSGAPWSDFVQTDAAVNPGNSGGALINERGELIGVNSRILNRDEDAQGIGFAIPANVVESVLEDLIKEGRVRRGWLGLEVTEPDSRGAERPGLYITVVETGGPADLAGLKSGDMLIAVDTYMPKSAIELGRMIALQKPGKTLELIVDRNADVLSVRVVVEERPRG